MTYCVHLRMALNVALFFVIDRAILEYLILQGGFCWFPTFFVPMSFGEHLYQGSSQSLLRGFFPLRGYAPPPPYPLNRKSFCHKNLSGIGGVPPCPLNEQLQKMFALKWSKGVKIEILDKKCLVFSGIFL